MNFGLQGKILFPSVCLFCALTAFSGWYSYDKAQSALKKSVLETLNGEVRAVAIGLDSTANSLFQDIEGISQIPPVVKLMLSPKNIASVDPEQARDHEALLEEINYSLKNRPFIKDGTFAFIDIIDDQGVVLASSLPDRTGSNVSQEAAFKEGMTGRKSASMALQRAENTAVVPFVVPITINGRIMGVVQADINFKKLADAFVVPVKIGQLGHAFVAMGVGEILYHPDSRQIMQKPTSTSLTPIMVQRGNGMLEYSWNDKQWMAIFQTSKDTHWTTIVKVNNEEVFAGIDGIAKGILVVGTVSLLVFAVFLFFVTRHFVSLLSKAISYAEVVAEGNLEQEFTLRSSDELGSLANSLRRMVQSLRSMLASSQAHIEETRKQAERAEQATQEAEASRDAAHNARREGMLAAAHQIEDVVQAVSSAMKHLSVQLAQSGRGTEQQAERIAHTAEIMTKMNNTVLDVARNAASASQMTVKTRDQAENGSRIVQKTLDNIQLVQTRSLSLKKDMGVLDEHARAITQIMNVISDIADQTNLLALNAAIEAARAGEAGRGFAVVADEVRKLAEKTMTSTAEVSTAIHSIQASVTTNAKQVDLAVEGIENSTALSQQSGSALAEIVTMVDSAADEVRAIAAASEQQSSTSEGINRAMNEVSVIAEQTAKSMREASHAVQDMDKQIERLTLLVTTLKSA